MTKSAVKGTVKGVTSTAKTATKGVTQTAKLTTKGKFALSIRRIRNS